MNNMHEKRTLKDELHKSRYNHDNIPKDLLIKLYVDEQRSARAIGKILDASSAKIRTYLRKYDIPVRTNMEQRTINRFKEKHGNNTVINPEALTIMQIPKDTLIKLYIDEQRGSSEIALILKTSKYIVVNQLKKYGIPIRSRWDQAFVNRLKKNKHQNMHSNNECRTTPPIPKDLLIKLYVNEQKGIHEVAHELNISATAVSKYLRQYGIRIRSRWDQAFINDLKKRKAHTTLKQMKT
jgi:predicted transcriptional regulator